MQNYSLKALSYTLERTQWGEISPKENFSKIAILLDSNVTVVKYLRPLPDSADPVKKPFGLARRWVFGLGTDSTSYARRGFRGATDEMRARLEQIGATFLRGYHAALEHGETPELAARLDSEALELRGFVYEGAAMGLTLLDFLTPWNSRRLARFLAGPGEPHAYMLHVGAGWLWARLPLSPRLERFDPLLKWLGFDGWGFHEGFFHWQDYVAGRRHPKRLSGYARHAFDQGLGRSFWFVNGGSPAWISQTLAQFPVERQPDLWSGLGLAATYAGYVSPAALSELQACAGPHRFHLAQGSAFAAKARQRAGNLTDYTDTATRVLCGVSARDAARVPDSALENLPGDGTEPAYELWRKRVRAHFEQLERPSQRPVAISVGNA